MIHEEKGIEIPNYDTFYEVHQQIRELFNKIFRIFTQQRKEIDHLQIQVDALQIPKDEILLGSLWLFN